MTSLSALHTVGDQIGEAVELHGGGGHFSNIHSLGDQISEAAQLVRPQAQPHRDRDADRRHAAHGGLPRSQAGIAHLSVRTLGRPAPARHDRHGAGLPAGAADRRRAHDRARRHHPGPDPAPHQGPAGRARHGAPDDHPRSRRRRQRRRRRRRDVSRQGRRIGRPARHLPRSAASLSQGAAACRAALRHGARRAAAADPRDHRRDRTSVEGKGGLQADRDLQSHGAGPQGPPPLQDLPDPQGRHPVRAAHRRRHHAHRARRQRRELRRRAQRVPGPGRRIGLRQDHAQQDSHARHLG